MAKKRVHEIAKAQGLSSKELLAALKAAGVEAKAAASSVEESDALQAISAAKGDGGTAVAEKAPAKAASKAAAKPKATELRPPPPDAKRRRRRLRAKPCPRPTTIAI